eukprot:363187-Chlamydomonas_euryale.AAC.2
MCTCDGAGTLRDVAAPFRGDSATLVIAPWRLPAERLASLDTSSGCVPPGGKCRPAALRASWRMQLAAAATAAVGKGSEPRCRQRQLPFACVEAEAAAAAAVPRTQMCDQPLGHYLRSLML